MAYPLENSILFGSTRPAPYLPAPPPSPFPNPPTPILQDLFRPGTPGFRGWQSNTMGANALTPGIATPAAPLAGNLPGAVRNTGPALDLASEAAGLGSKLRPLEGIGPVFNPGSLAARLPTSGIAGVGSKLLTGGGKLGTGARRFALGLGINQAGKLARTLEGDTAPDPTNALQAFTRGAQGGGELGSWFGAPGAAVGALGAGLGNTGGYLATGGQGHLGNVPLIGGFFGGGSASGNQPTGPDLSPEGLKAKLDSFNLDPNLRSQVRDQFNQNAADLRAQGLDNTQAMTQTYNKFFAPKTDKEGNITENAKVLGLRDAYAESQATAGDQTTSSQAALSAQAEQAMAMQALIAQIAPELLGQGLTSSLDAYNTIMPGIVASQPANLQGLAAQSQADANLRNSEAQVNASKFLQAIPQLAQFNITQQAQAAAAKQAGMIQQLQLEQAIREAGKAGGTDILEGL